MTDQRYMFIQDYLEGRQSLTELCLDYQISRKTGYKWIERFKVAGREGLNDRSRARHTQATKTSNEHEERILEIKHQFPTWGPKKIFAYLQRHEPNEAWPSLTTMGSILSRHGLTRTRRKRRRFPVTERPLSQCTKPNDTWCIDFKGWFTTKDKVKCDPLTITDAHSRYILFCSKLHSGKARDVWETMSDLFHENGLPKYLRHDNGPPFATSGVGRLSALSVNLIKAGVTPEWIDPGKPYQNGRHERMHLTLKQEGVYPLKLTLEEQQMKFGDFVHYYNQVRPHEGIEQKVPSDLYMKSPRKWNGELQSPEYGSEFLVKRVRKHGQVAGPLGDVFIGKALGHEPIGFKEGEDGQWLVYYGPILLATMDHRGNLLIPHATARPKRKYTERCF